MDSLYTVAFNDIGNYIRKGQVEAEKYYQASLFLQDSAHLPYALDLKGFDAYIRDNLDSAKFFANKSVALFRDLNDSLGLSTAIYNLSTYHEYLGEFTTALRLLHLAREIDIRLGYKLYNDAFYYNRLSEIAYNQDQIELALRYLHKAWDAQVTSKYWHSYLTPILHQNFAWLYYELEIDELAVYHAKLAYSMTSPDSLLTIRSNAVDVLSKVARRKGDWDAALNFAKTSVRLGKEYGDPYYVVYSHLFLMEHFAAAQDFQTAQLYADSVLAGGTSFNRNPVFRVDINQSLYTFYKEKGDLKSALSHLELCTDARKLINEVDGAAAMKQFDEEMASRYKALLKAKSQLQEEEINLRNTLLISTLLVLSGVLVFVLFLYISNQKIRQVNSKLTAMNKEISAQKEEIHQQSNLLEERNADLEKMNASKDRLFSVLAHDLRQPFNQIIGVIDLMEHHNLDPKDRKSLLKGLKSSVQDTAELVSNVLTWSKAQFAGVTVNPEHLPLANTVKKALLHFSIALDKKNIKVIFDIAEDLSVVFDKDHFESVLRNIFSNAYKFSPRGATIYIRAWADANHGRVFLSIRDEGLGMDQYQIEQLMHGEQMVDSINGTLNEQGSGIGMIIVRDFLKENDASFDIESKLNEGSTFILNMLLGKKYSFKPISNLKSVQDLLS